MNLISQDLIDIERWRRIESVLDVALELDPREVGAYLDRACAASPELRAEIEDLLDADRRARGFLTVGALAMVRDMVDAPGPAFEPLARAEAVPERLGRYRVLEELGRGGMGIVYRGRDETLGREVAIKSLPRAVAADPDRLARFLREARLLAALHHPNIAGIRGVEQADGRRYLILEKVDGATLAERLRSGPLETTEALDCCAQVASALAAAHAYGVVHRDLKPGNIMRTAGGLVKVLDFGLAMHVSEGGSGARHGTPGYMSPEQILGAPQDERTDLFALGVVLYQCLTGARAFTGESARAVTAATLEASPDFSRLPVDTPEPVRVLLACMLETEPAKRWADSAGAASVLGACARTAPGRAGIPVRGTHGLRVPERMTPLVGRGREIDELLSLLGRAPIVTLTGSAGCGKSRLAIEVASAALGANPIAAGDASARRVDEAWLAELSAATDAAGVSAAIASAAELTDPSESGLAAGLSTRLGGRTGLLVLDDCDHVLAACRVVAGRFSGIPGLRIVATSRERLGLPGEQTYAVAPLAVPDPDSPRGHERIAQVDSARLFEACAGSLPGGFAITDTNAGLVADICRDLDGVPLAIELTAALLRHQTLDEVAAGTRRRVGAAAAAQDRGAGEDRCDALQAAIRHGYEGLADDERRFLRATSVFAGGWNLDSATAVCDEPDAFATLDLLTRLIDKSLVTIQRADRIEPRYRLLEPIHRFASIAREADAEGSALRVRHREWFLALAEQSAPLLLKGSDQAHRLALLEADHANLLGALSACEAEAGGAPVALRLAGSLWLFWYIRGHFTRGREALARALAMPGADARTPARAQALFAAGGLALFQGDFAEGRRLSESALALYQSLDDAPGVARSLTHLALCDSGQGRYAEARAHTERAILNFRAAGDSRRLSAALNNLGVFKRQQGDSTGALPDHEEALDLQRQAGDRDGMLVTLLNLGLAAARAGREELATTRVDEALALVLELRARRSAAAALEVAAEVLATRGLAESGVRLLGAAKTLRSTIGLAPDAGWRRMLEELEARLRASVPGGRFEALDTEGSARSFEVAVDEARQLLAGVRT